MANFLTAFNYMIVNEDSQLSGVVIKDNDGGTTRLGLDSNANPELLKNGFYIVPVAEAITMAQMVYQQKYWAAIWGDQIISQRVASKFLDMAVNEDSPEAIKLTQRAAFGMAFGPQIDGVMGTKTLNTINDDNEIGLLTSMVVWNKWFNHQTVVNKPQYKKFLDGWLARSSKIPEVV